MNRERELLEEILRCPVRHGFRTWRQEIAGFHHLSHSTKTKCERLMRVVVAKFQQQASNRGNSATGTPNKSKGFRNGLLLFANLLEQEAFKLSAIRRSIRINPAMATGSQGPTRLWELKANGCGFGTRAANSANFQTQILQAGGVIAGLQFDGAKEGAIAAHAAAQAEVVG